MKRSAALLGLLACAAVACADDTSFLPAWNGLTGARIAKHVEVLASDAFEGREPGTPGEEKTLRYLEQQMRAAGVAPAVDGGYRHRVPLTELKLDGTPRFAMAGGGDRTAMTFQKDFVVFAGRPAKSVDLHGLPVVFAGFGITAPEFDWDDYRDVDVEGAAVVLLRSEPGGHDDSTLFRGRALTVHGMTPTKYDLAAARGARAAIVVHIDSLAGFPWSAYAGGGGGSTQNFLAEDASLEKLDAIVHMNVDAARAMLGRAGLDLDALVRSAGRRGFVPVATGLTADVAFEAKTRAFDSYNVIGKVEGRGRPDECVIYTGHWDHVGRNPKLEGDQIFNGAVDNATGTAVVLELARAFASLREPPRRTVYFVATTAEEKGLLGAEHLARHPLVPLARTAAVLNLDALFPFGPFAAMTVPGYGSSEVEDVMAQAAARIGRVLQDDSTPEVGAYYRSDHYPFAKRGVPAVFAVGGPRTEELEDESNPVLARFTDYVTNGYHKPADEYDAETWDMAGIEGDARVFFETGWRIAQQGPLPNWRAGNEFRALRDAMRDP